MSILKRSYGNALRRLRRSGRSKAIPEVITPIPNFLAHVLHFKMAAENTELNTSLFMEEVQKYPTIYNKFSTDYKNKFIRMNIWKAIGEKFGLDAAEAEKKYKNVRTVYGRHLRKKKSVPSGSGRDAVPSLAEFSNLDWSSNHINQLPPTVTNVQSRDEREDDANHGEEAESANNVQDSLEYEETSSEDDLQSETSVSPAADSPSSSAAANDGQSNRSSRQKGKSTPKITKSTTKRPWASNARKAVDSDVDMALLRTATSLADRLLQPEQPKKSRTEEEEDEDAIYCRSLANRLRNSPVHVKGYVRLQIEQLMYQVQFCDHHVFRNVSWYINCHDLPETRVYPRPTIKNSLFV